MQEPSEEPFDINSVLKEVRSQPLAEKKATNKKHPGLDTPLSAPTTGVDAYEKLLSSIPEFSSFGKLFKVLWMNSLLLLTEYGVLNYILFLKCSFLAVFGSCRAY